MGGAGRCPAGFFAPEARAAGLERAFLTFKVPFSFFEAEFELKKVSPPIVAGEPGLTNGFAPVGPNWTAGFDHNS
jgi:hypothetical protein